MAITSAAEELNSGLPRTTPASGLERAGGKGSRFYVLRSYRSAMPPVVASQLPDDFDKGSKEEKAKGEERRAFLSSVTGLKFPYQPN